MISLSMIAGTSVLSIPWGLLDGLRARCALACCSPRGNAGARVYGNAGFGPFLPVDAQALP